MKIRLQINYHTNWGQSLYVYGPGISADRWDENQAVQMLYVSPSKWAVELEIEQREILEYRYLVKNNGQIADREWGDPHFINMQKGKTIHANDMWQSIPQQKFLYTSGFTDSFFFHDIKSKINYYHDTILLNVYCPYVKKNQTLILCGSSDTLGDWKTESALHFTPVRYGLWQLSINAAQVIEPQEFKLAIYDNELQQVVQWEEGANRILKPLVVDDTDGFIKIKSIGFRLSWMNWKAAGVAIPVFSLRSEDSFGIGEFPDLKKMVDWAAETGQKVIQLLPVNDTTITYTWVDSYPYNAISIYALHPLFLGLKEFPLKNKALYKKYEEEAAELNKLDAVDYDKALALKLSYIRDLFKESGEKVLNSKEYQEFFQKNESWLFSYACFCHLRDKNKTADYSLWKYHSVFDLKKLKRFVSGSAAAKSDVNLIYFTQYLLHKQLVDVKEYAHQHQVILKGDIPIGINRFSVEAWVEPHLFNLNVQAGAPPDDFSFFGQNWGFPTYNWDEMAKDGYEWWVRRFRKMADYFDAYRIDHILGFFRIWEIPMSSVQAILGYFSPAIPLSMDEIHSYGFWLERDRMIRPYIHQHFLGNIFGIYMQEVIDKYLLRIDDLHYELKEEYNTQLKIKEYFAAYNDDKAKHIRDGLYYLCNEVLFIRDKKEPDKYHPRITSQYSYSYKDLDDNMKRIYNNLYDDFFFRRHSQYWREQAMQRLPELISSNSMLVCGEDLGMVPDSVPSVMSELQILRLEIERMPKELGVQFENLSNLPYLSVCTTSTHDMSPIRLWWKEDRNLSQQYYNQVLGGQGIAPEDCNSDVAWQIISNHLNSPAMLAILPIQDWLAIDDKLKRINPEEERINIPAVPQNYWRYRMHLTLEELIQATAFNKRIKSLVETSGRE